VNFEIAVNDVDAIYQSGLKAEIKPFREMKQQIYRGGGQEIVQKKFLIQDLDGYLLRFTD